LTKPRRGKFLRRKCLQERADARISLNGALGRGSETSWSVEHDWECGNVLKELGPGGKEALEGCLSGEMDEKLKEGYREDQERAVKRS